MGSFDLTVVKRELTRRTASYSRKGRIHRHLDGVLWNIRRH